MTSLPDRKSLVPLLPHISLRTMPAALAAALFVVLAIANFLVQPEFFQGYIITSNLTAFLPLMLIAMGQAYIVLGGSIDLSLGAIVSLVNVIVVVLTEAWGGGTGAMLGAMAVGLAAGALGGVFNGVLIGALRLPAVVTTFATGVIIGGLALRVMPQAGGALPPAYYLTYGGDVFGIPVVALCLSGAMVFALWLARTSFYAHLLALGGNRQSAYQTGLGLIRLRVMSHVIGALLASCAALAVLGVAGAGDPLMGQAFTLSSVSAIVLGGVALSGGWGGAWGALLGASILGLINNLIFFSSIPYVYQNIVQGAIVLLALAGGVFMSRRPQ